MPLELQIIRASEFIRMSAHGHFDLAASKAALVQLVRACRKRGINQAMVDLRALPPSPKPIFTSADLAELVRAFLEAGFPREQRLAILYHSDPHYRARLFAFLTTMRGWAVRAFGDFEKALFWISKDEEPGPRRRRSPAGKQISVRFAKAGGELRAGQATPRSRRKRRVGTRVRTFSARGRTGRLGKGKSHPVPRRT
jgi:hypothetical protein